MGDNETIGVSFNIKKSFQIAFMSICYY